MRSGLLTFCVTFLLFFRNKFLAACILQTVPVGSFQHTESEIKPINVIHTTCDNGAPCTPCSDHLAPQPPHRREVRLRATGCLSSRWSRAGGCTCSNALSSSMGRSGTACSTWCGQRGSEKRVLRTQAHQTAR